MQKCSTSTLQHLIHWHRLQKFNWCNCLLICRNRASRKKVHLLIVRVLLAARKCQHQPCPRVRGTSPRVLIRCSSRSAPPPASRMTFLAKTMLKKNKRTKSPKYYWQRKKTWKERWLEKHGWSGGAWHWRVGVRDEQRTTVHQLFPPAFPFFSCFPLSCFISWWFGPNSLSQLLSSFLDCWLSKQHDGRVWLLVVGAVSQGHRAIRAKGPHRKYFCWDLHTLLF